jgi:hypothetical protein
MWLLEFVPDGWLYYAALSVITSGFLIYVTSFIVELIPTYKVFVGPMRILSTLLLVTGVFFYGSYSAEKKNIARIEQLQKEIKLAEEKSKQVNTKIVTKIVKKVKRIHDKQIEIHHDIKVVEKKVDSECKVDPEAVRILNKSAKDL